MFQWLEPSPSDISLIPVATGITTNSVMMQDAGGAYPAWPTSL